MAGKIFIYLAFFFSLGSIYFFLSVHYGKENLIKIARTFYLLTAASVVSAAAFLLYLIVTHQYQYTYVWEQSNNSLGPALLLSTFYAGQEGSFMLWTFFTSVIGIFLLRYVSKGDRLEPQVMSIYSLILGFLAFIIILKSPFNYVWDSFPGENIPVGFVPADGRGLNPLLQNFWMSIHPPTLFIGFSSMAVPFCFAIATLMKNKYNEWIRFSLPWFLFSGGILGLGIMMGGYWAYGVLGWGGYWAWDPVENSSFIPWLIVVASIHTMVAQKRTGGYKKTNIILAILAFLLVLYSTFLTRSGVLGDSSVHSFVDPGQEVYLSLIVFISTFVLISIVAVIARFKSISAEVPETNKLLSRETALFVGAITLCAAAFVILAGTSWPIIQKGSVDTQFYNNMNLPIAILIALINGFSLLLKWKNTKEQDFLKGLIFPLLLAGIITIGLVIIGVKDFLIAVFALAALFAFFVNAEIAVQMFRKKKSSVGAYIAHVGLALVFLGIIASSKYSEEVHLTLERDKPVEAFGYKMTYTGFTPFNDPGRADTLYHFNVLLEKDGKELQLQPVMFYSAFSNGVLKNPDIAKFPTKDLYLSPMSMEEPELFTSEDTLQVKKGETKDFKNFKIEFLDFDFGSLVPGGKEIQSGTFQMGAKIKVSDNKFSEILSPKINYSEGQIASYDDAKMSGKDNIHFYLLRTNVKSETNPESSVMLAVTNDNDASQKEKKNESLIVTASIKPFINVLWTGTIILVLGFFISIIRRRKELKA